MASKAKTIGSTDSTQPGTAVEERERLLHSTSEQEIREVARTRFICSAGHNLAMSWRIGFRPNVSSHVECFRAHRRARKPISDTCGSRTRE